MTALKSPEESAQNFFAPPTSLYLDNIIEIVTNENFFTYFFNSIFITVLSVGAIALIVPMVSYAISRNMHSNKYYKSIYFMFVIGIFVPFQVLMLPITNLASKLGLMNQWGLILFYITFGLTQGIFLFVGYLKSIPLELDEAAKMDGCNIIQTFFYIIFPVVKPMTATIVILNTLWVFNDFLLPILILNRSSSLWTLPLFQYNFQSQYTFDYNLAFASYLFTIIPMLIIFIVMQKHIVKGLTSGTTE
ncbi:carbohydrate ABC transporter permease [Amphibacillus sp. Q70]|uniref:carbohydrate ABC transporter permease n=1 Tax=Amphibacillus sp. Q70 TaxID=3453416 RepID=UPI003F835026